MPSTLALCNTLIGRYSWEDSKVLHEWDILLGDNVKESQDYIQHTCISLIVNFKSSYAKMVEIEQHAFGDNSFFGH